MFINTENTIMVYSVIAALLILTAITVIRSLESRNQWRRMIKDGEVEVKGPSEAESLRLVIRATLLLGSIAFIGFAGWAGWIWWQNRRRYRFPEVESSELLGAPHAAGVGAVLSFGNSQLSPSKQRDQAPDYLQRM